MNESMGNAMLFNIVITFVIIMVGFFIASLAYSKAYKVKNKIVEEIEKERTFDSDVASEVESWMQSNNVGYRVNTGSFTCDDYDGTEAMSVGGQNYQYCVYELTTCNKNTEDRCGNYYHVITYMYLDLPVLEDVIKIPVNGETMTFIEVNS